MNMDFEAALRYIDLGNYDKAVELLNKAIADEEAAENGIDSTQYRCVLGELLLNLENKEAARAEFEKVIAYCDENNVLEKQRRIARTYIDVLDGKLEMPKQSASAGKRPGFIPLVPKPVQDKGFIAKQMNKKHR